MHQELFSRLLNLAQQTGERVVFVEDNNAFVLLGLDAYELLVGSDAKKVERGIRPLPRMASGTSQFDTRAETKAKPQVSTSEGQVVTPKNIATAARPLSPMVEDSYDLEPLD